MGHFEKGKDSKGKNSQGIQKEIKTIAVLCSGGDAPAMNSAIRAVVRSAVGLGLKVYGVKKGYSGLLTGDIQLMDASSVGNILQRGGTILQTSRCDEFFKEETRKEAANIIKRKGIDGLIVIGGNGSLKGAKKLYQEHGIPIVGIPGSIDNDIKGTDYSIGFDTAVQNAVEAVDKIRDTANSHERNFIVEVKYKNISKCLQPSFNPLGNHKSTGTNRIAKIRLAEFLSNPLSACCLGPARKSALNI